MRRLLRPDSSSGPLGFRFGNVVRRGATDEQYGPVRSTDHLAGHAAHDRANRSCAGMRGHHHQVRIDSLGRGDNRSARLLDTPLTLGSQAACLASIAKLAAAASTPSNTGSITHGRHPHARPSCLVVGRPPDCATRGGAGRRHQQQHSFGVPLDAQVTVQLAEVEELIIIQSDQWRELSSFQCAPPKRPRVSPRLHRS